MDVMVLGLRDRQEIEEIINSTSCSKGFECYTSGLESLCKVMSFAGGQMIECMDDTHPQCEFRTAFGWGHVCKCPLRKYVADKFQR
jgi:hypothetical protein